MNMAGVASMTAIGLLVYRGGNYRVTVQEPSKLKRLRQHIL